MLSSELAFDEDGEPFLLPTEVKGWRARRVPRRGRPALVNDRGKPLIIPVDATHADLLAVAGPGRYRLEAVDEHGRKVDGIPVACTGTLSEDEQDDEATGDDEEGETMFSGSAGRRVRMEDVLCQLLTNQTRMVEATLAQMGTVIAGVGGLLHAVHQTGVVHQVPPQVAVLPPQPMPPPAELEPDEGEADAEIVEVDRPSKLPEALRIIIEKATEKAVALIFEKITSGEGLGGLPLAAFLDWRKAMPHAAPAAPATAPAGPATAPAAPAAPAAAYTAPVATPPTASAPQAGPASGLASVYASHGITAAPLAPAPTPAGAAPSPASPLGAAPAATATAPTSSVTPQELTQEEAAAMLNTHILQIWQGLTPPERSRASELISSLTDTQRSAWLAELARLTVPEAVARARAVLRAQPLAAPPTNPLQTATPKGDPS
jgi:hypothetical protein